MPYAATTSSRARLARGRCAGLVLALLPLACSEAASEHALSESEAVTTQCPKETVEGLDVYQGQGTIDWSKLAARVTSDSGLTDGGSSASEDGYVFAFIKATQGNYDTQRTFAANWLNAKSAGLLRGAYHYFDPRIEGVVQADYFLAEVGEDSGELPALLDIECPTSANEADASSNCEYSGNSGWVDSGTLTKRIFDWLATVAAKTGRKPIVYSYPSWFSAVGLTDLRLAGYPLFIASPAACAAVPAPWTSAAFWQYGTSALVPGIVGACSLDRWTGDLASLKAFAASHRGADAGSVVAAGALDGSFLDASRVDSGLEASSIIDGTVSTAGSSSAGAALAEAGSSMSSADAALVETGTGRAGLDAASAEVGATGEAREVSALSARTEGGCGCEVPGARRGASHAPVIAWLVLVVALARLRRDRAPRRMLDAVTGYPRLGEELGFRDRVAFGLSHRIGQREDFDQHHAVHRVHVVHVDLLGVGVQGRVDVLVDVRQHVRLLHGDHVVTVE